jgi:hypothetical protein
MTAGGRAEGALESLPSFATASGSGRDCFGLEACLVLKHVQPAGLRSILPTNGGDDDGAYLRT